MCNVFPRLWGGGLVGGGIEVGGGSGGPINCHFTRGIFATVLSGFVGRVPSLLFSFKQLILWLCLMEH